MVNFFTYYRMRITISSILFIIIGLIFLTVSIVAGSKITDPIFYISLAFLVLGIVGLIFSKTLVKKIEKREEQKPKISKGLTITFFIAVIIASVIWIFVDIEKIVSSAIAIAISIVIIIAMLRKKSLPKGISGQRMPTPN